MISKTPITKAMPHGWSVYHQCLIRCGITECSCCPVPSPDSVVMFHLTSLLSAAHLEMDIPGPSWRRRSRRPRTTWLIASLQTLACLWHTFSLAHHHSQWRAVTRAAKARQGYVYLICLTDYWSFLPHDAMRNCGLCCGPVSVCLSQLKISSNFFVGLVLPSL